MSSALSAIPIERRRRLAATIGLFAMLFVTVGIVATTGTTPGVVRVFSAVSLSLAVLLAAIGWGVMHSVKIDIAERELDAAIATSIASLGRDEIACGCGHDHDPDEMHVSDARCAYDGRGVDCTHSCETCVLTAMRPSPTTSRSARLAE